MRRALLFLLLAIPLSGFSLVELALTPATPMVWYEARGPVAGTQASLSGYTSATSAAVHVAAQGRIVQRIKGVDLSMNITTAGVGAGNMVVEAYDNTGTAALCSSTRVCTSGNFSVACASGVAAAPGSTLLLRVDASACTNAPVGTIQFTYTQAVVDEGVDFVPRFIPYGLWGLDGGGNFFGLDSYQFDSITCGWDSPGVVSGGTDVMEVQLIQKSDGGVVCECTLPGACNDAAGSEHTCYCGAKKFLGTQVEPGLRVHSGYSLQWTTDTNCAANPSNIVCGIPFRK